VLELAIELPEHDARILHRLQRVPGHHHLGRRIRAELQMQSCDRRCLHRIGRCSLGGSGFSAARSDEGGRHDSRAADASSGEQFSATEFEIEFNVLSHWWRARLQENTQVDASAFS
jgi:hypothetical protein